MDTTGVIPTMDVGNNSFGDGGMWIFALLILVLLGNGGLFGNNKNTATQSDVVYTSAFNQLQDENTAIRADIQRTAYESMATTKDTAYNNLSELRDIQAGIANGFANMQTCCCNTSKEILESRYLAAQNTAEQTANLTAQINALSSKIDQNKIEALQEKVSELQLAQAMNGVVRYPNGFTYNAGASPFCGCNGQNI